ncbi:MAG: PaaI family thioesterase [Vitreoscilla sp.]|nr:PaaI family thioesterase [Vitreoscilla sp.]
MSRTKIPFPVRVPFVESLGLELNACAHGASELRVDLADAHMNSWEVAHGGVLMTMLDVAMATAARSDHLDGPGVATIEMKTSFVRPAEGELRALGKLLHRTSTLAFCEASVLDDAGELCAHATGTFKYLRKLPVKGRGVKALQRTNPDTP